MQFRKHRTLFLLRRLPRCKPDALLYKMPELHLLPAQLHHKWLFLLIPNHRLPERHLLPAVRYPQLLSHLHNLDPSPPVLPVQPVHLPVYSSHSPVRLLPQCSFLSDLSMHSTPLLLRSDFSPVSSEYWLHCLHHPPHPADLLLPVIHFLPLCYNHPFHLPQPGYNSQKLSQ